VLGGAVGAFAGWAMSQYFSAARDARLQKLEGTIGELQHRVALLERRQVEASAATGVTTAPDETPIARPAGAPPTAPAQSARAASVVDAIQDDFVGPPDPEAPAPIADRLETPALPARPRVTSPARHAEEPKATSDLRPRIIGMALGALAAVSWGLLAMAIGALIGALIVLAVQAQNRRAARERSGTARAKDSVAAPPDVSVSVGEGDTTTAGSAAGDAMAAGPCAPLMHADAAPDDQPKWLQRLIGGNIVAKVGVLILFFGVGFLLKYAYEQGVLPVPVRLAGVGAVGVGMLVGGWRLLERRRLYALILQGGGIGLLYLDVFFALRVYGLVDATTGFAAFMALGVAATLLAVRQDAKVLAVLGLTGAFLAPVLAGSKSGNHVGLFSYYTLLNAFILTISWFKAWRDLNLVGFIFTFAVALLWGAENYRPELFSSVEPFVLVFVAMYLVIPILFAQRQPPELKGLIDGTLVFGTPLCTAFMQAALVKDLPYGLAWSAGVASALYAVLAAMTIRREGLRLLGETYVALSVVFGTLTVFFAFDAYPTFALWTLEGAAIVWVGLRQRRALARWFGYALQLAGTAYFVSQYRTYDLSAPYWNPFVLGCAIVAAAGFILAWLLHKFAESRGEAEPSPSLLLIWAAAWWSIGGVHVLYHGFDGRDFPIALLVFIAASVAAFEILGSRLHWRELRQLALVQLPALVAVALLIAFGNQGRFEFVRPLANGGYWAWPANLLLLFWIYTRQTRDNIIPDANHAFGIAWLMVALLATWDAAWLLGHSEYGQALGWGGAAIAAACARFRLREREAADAPRIAFFILAWGLAFWFVSGLAWIEHDLQSVAKPMAVLAFIAGSCFGFELVGSFVQWPVLRRCATALVAGMAAALFMQIVDGVHPFAAHGWLTWPSAVALLWIVLRRQENDGVAIFVPAQHLMGLWFTVAVLTAEAAWQLDAMSLDRPYLAAACGLLPALAVLAISRCDGKASWPFGVHSASIYREQGLGVIAAYLVLWSLVANFSAPGSMRPLPYVPLLNPLDLAQIMVFVALWRWSRTLAGTLTGRTEAVLALSALGFLWVNCAMLRTFHYWANVPYQWDALSRSVLVQSGFSLLWTSAAFVLMLYATRSSRRRLWIAGAVLLGMVVVKLFLNDLSNTGTIARIVSFLGVGAGLLLIGYVAPVPPGDRELQGD
jgi:uncharacterized membrane protein